MFAIAFDLVVANTERYHPKGVPQAYADISALLQQYGFLHIQGSLYVCQEENMSQLFMAIAELQSLDWFPPSVRDIRAFRVEQWSDFTTVVKQSTSQIKNKSHFSVTENLPAAIGYY